MPDAAKWFPPRRVWFITGTSSGIGRCLAITALSRGDRVIATARDVSKIQDLSNAGAFTMQLDVGDDFSVVQRKAKEAIGAYGQIDVIVNNAGYGVYGALEEVGTDGFMEQYRTNVFGVVNVTNAFLPHMRHRREGIVVIIGSRSGWKTQYPLVSPYGSSKAAVHAIAESLTEELRPFGIRVLSVQPGSFRTQMIRNCQLKLGTTVQRDYREYHMLCAKLFADGHGSQPGDPQKAVDVIADVVRGEGCAVGKQWPNFLVLGEDAEQDIRLKCLQMLERLDNSEWRDVARSVAF